MNTDEAMKSLKAKFTSGNSVAVSQATITREEYEAILAYQQATKESEAEVGRLRESLEFCKSTSGGRADDIDGMDTQLCEIWVSTDEALKEADR